MCDVALRIKWSGMDSNKNVNVKAAFLRAHWCI